MEELASATRGLGTLRVDLGWVLEWMEGVWEIGVWFLIGFLKVTVFVFTVFLLPLLHGEGEGLQCGLGIRVVRGSLKLTISIFMVFLKLLGVGREMVSYVYLSH